MNMQSNQHIQREKIVPPNAIWNGMQTSAENAEGINVKDVVGERLSEIVSDLPSEPQTSTAGDKAKSARRLTQQEIKERLLAHLPSEKRMKAEIESKISKEIRSLQSKVSKMIYFSINTDYFELNNILAKIHELTDVLASLAKATFEMIKNLWLRFVHGIAV